MRGADSKKSERVGLWPGEGRGEISEFYHGGV